MKEELNMLGLAGEVFTEAYCKKNKIQYKKASTVEDRVLGIDAYIGKEETPIDIKNTKDIYFCQIQEDGRVNVRHPFKKGSKAEKYFFVNVDMSGQGKFLEQIDIREKLLRDFIKGKESLVKFYTYLQSIDQVHYKELGNNVEQVLLLIKKNIQSCCNSETTVSYPEPENNIEVSLKLKEKVKEEKPSIQSLQSMRGILKERLKEKEGNFSLIKEGIIIINI